MRLKWVESLVLLLLGCAAIWDGISIPNKFKTTFGSAQSGGYEVLLGMVLVCLVAWHSLRPTRDVRGAESGLQAEGGLQWVLIGFAILAGYVFLINYLGYLLSTLLFLAVYFRLFGGYRWAPTLIGSVAIAAGSAYIWAETGMMLPQGPLPWP